MWFQFHQRRGHYPIKHLTWRALQQYSTAFSHQLFLKTSLSYIFLLGFWLTFVFIIRISYLQKQLLTGVLQKNFPHSTTWSQKDTVTVAFVGPLQTFFRTAIFQNTFGLNTLVYTFIEKLTFLIIKKDNSWPIVIFSQD